MINGYDIAYALAGAAAAPLWLLKGSARRKVLRAVRERTGRGVAPRAGAGPAVMVHAVSMGEINATRALVKELRDARPDLHVIVTTTTDTGFERGRQLYGDVPGVTLAKFPLDFSGAVGRLLDNLRPDVVALMELEVWPNFMRQCERRGIPVMVINARLTPHSTRGYRWGGPVTRRMFARLAAVGAQERAYADQFVGLGVAPERVTVTGTMKFDTAEVGETVPGAAELGATLGLRAGEPLWVCGSTGPGEERLVLEAYRELLRELPALRLAIIPRHPDRFDEVEELIRNDYAMNVIRRSEPPSAGEILEMRDYCLPPILLGDTMGELRKFYAIATVVLVGRTLVDLGPRQRGSDMIEPAALAKPTIVGPWTQNFAEVMNAFRADDAIVEIDGVAQLTSAIRDILNDPAAAAERGVRAQGTVRRKQGATAAHVGMILARLDGRGSA